ncbi:MAG: HAD-IA family hydrolase [Halioglobus sp.]
MIIIFDWDGTLCDSVEHIVAAMQAAAAEFEVPAPAAPAIRDIVGLGLPQAMAVLFPQLQEQLQLKLRDAYSQHYVSADSGPASLFGGAMETLLALRSRDFELAVATGKSRRGLNRVLSGLGLEEFFDITRCADETRSKPHPQMLNEIMHERDKGPHEVVMVGDTEYDLGMAREAGVRSVGVSFGVHSTERLAHYEPMAIIDALPQLLELELQAS